MSVDQFDYMPPPPPGAEWWACDPSDQPLGPMRLVCRACGARWTEGETPEPCTHPARRGSHETYTRPERAESGER